MEVRSPIKRLTPPSKYEADRERQIDDEKDRAEIDNSQVDVVSIYDYKEEEIEKLENQLIRSISLLMLIARCLPNFEHRLKKHKSKRLYGRFMNYQIRFFMLGQLRQSGKKMHLSR